MSTQNLSTVISKKIIAEKSKAFDSLLMKAQNDFERVKCLEDMKKFITLELDNWIKQLSSYDQLDEAEQLELSKEAKQRISELNELIDQINQFAFSMRENALLIQNVLIREGKIPHPAIT